MSADASQSGGSVRPREYFATTQWTVVFNARSADPTNAGLALEKICKVYWYPLYAHIRRRGYDPEDAKDLTQGFFERLLEQNSFAHADPQRGKFRSFILGAMNHFLADQSARARAEKRGGGRALQLGMNEGAVRTAVHRLRKRYRELLRDEIAGTVTAATEVNDEIRYLLLISGTA